MIVHALLALALQLCEERPQMTEEMFQQMVSKAKTELIERQRQMALEEQQRIKQQVPYLPHSDATHLKAAVDGEG